MKNKSFSFKVGKKVRYGMLCQWYGKKIVPARKSKKVAGVYVDAAPIEIRQPDGAVFRVNLPSGLQTVGPCLVSVAKHE